ncbi:hypothetical protein Acr_08g0003980 [Actinidia rufa]|uniref:Uncharacterized protein n=1 Tax=Actinidia rufa TaxID=165716 RepID=A0A7J0EZZ2_9ERIC|nr:hypothetical protein Acr_08g0003980 [Actinidia rufa]
MCIWLLYQIKHSDDNSKPTYKDPNTKSKINKELVAMLIGRKAASKIRVGSVTERFGGVYEKLPSEAEQDFPGNQIEKTWESIGSHEGRWGEIDIGGDFVKKNVNIEQETKEEEHEIEMSGFQYFHDENGVPPEELNTR